jgi:GNAT superfamily N-acetyltransferase
MFIVRQADTTHIPHLAHHRAAMFRDMGQIVDPLDDRIERATASYLREALPRGEFLAWVAELDGSPATVIGGAGVQLRPILPRPRPGTEDLELGPEAIVLNVYVEPAWRRHGVAEALMQALLTTLSEWGVRRVVLHAAADARSLYERLGFVATNEMRLE